VFRYWHTKAERHATVDESETVRLLLNAKQIRHSDSDCYRHFAS